VIKIWSLSFESVTDKFIFIFENSFIALKIILLSNKSIPIILLKKISLRKKIFNAGFYEGGGVIVLFFCKNTLF